ncbi:MAG TPA: caspase family protein [Thioploca sp.]|nr:MAG: hypothetical protein DRR19_16130 [Gammaproteobacteria bacterium]HDN27419.1 caspase family protein [Thioploca sp.]
MIKSRHWCLTGLLLMLLNLSACQTSPEFKSKGLFDWFFNNNSQTAPTQRRCFSNLPPPRQRTRGTVFLLATGANTGKLTETSTDVKQFSQTMQHYFKMHHLQICQLSNVYKAELEKALYALNQQLISKDLAIIYFSGHGTRMRDNNHDEQDGWDEALVTYDIKGKHRYDIKDDDGLRDDRFVELVNALPTDRVLTVMDTCFSSGMYLGHSTPDVLLANARRKFLVKGPLGTQEPRFESNKNTVITHEVGNLDSLKGLLLAAAGEKEAALELPKQGSLFTLNLVEQLQMNADLKQAFNRTAKQVRETTKHRQLPQTPQARGNWEILEENSN